MRRKPLIHVWIVAMVVCCTAMVVPAATADLVPMIKCPGKAIPGQDLGTTISVKVRNTGDTAAARFAVDLILSTDMSAPMKFAVYTANFKEDCLLLGGREHEENLAPNATRSVTLYGNNRIPADTPPGIYYLGVVIDPGNEVSESNERNNMAFCRIRVNRKVVGTIKPATLTAMKKLKTPKQISPENGSLMKHYPRKVKLRWRAIRKVRYDVQIDCLHCRQSGQWDSENGPAWKNASGLENPNYDFVFVGDNKGRWRVRSTRGKMKSAWSPWWYFRFNTSVVAIKKPDLGMYGFLKLGKNKRLVKWGQSITLTPADATLISNGKPAFEVYYACREFNNIAAGPFLNKLFFNGNLVSKQTNLKLGPREIRPIHTQAYLGPRNGRLKINVDADNNVAETREDNNFNFFVKLRFKGFPAVRALPDLVVKDIRTIEDCKMKVTIANIGNAGVPETGYDLKNGVAIQMYRFSDPWGGIRLGAVDSGGNLKSPGGVVSWIWFPGSANLNLSPGVQSIKVVVDNNNAVTESNEGNNHRTERLACGTESSGETPDRPCGVRLDRLSPSTGKAGTVFRMYGQWGGSQGTKIPAINRGGMNRLIVVHWSSTILTVRVPTGLEPGVYKVGVYCSDPAAGTTYSSGWKDFKIRR